MAEVVLDAVDREVRVDIGLVAGPYCLRIPFSFIENPKYAEAGLMKA